MFKLIAIAAAALASCTAAPAAKQAPAVSTPPCAPGEVIVSVNEEVGCDLIGGVNTLTLTDISPQMAADFGCTFDGDDAGVNCDF
jgi:hypothetical protein